MSFKPMLAHEYEKYKNKVVFPCAAQPKLDGIRCIAHVVKKMGGTRTTLYTRNGKIITSMPHIIEDLNTIKLKCPELYLDGELVSPIDTFEELCSLVKRKEPADRHCNVEFHVFDMCAEEIQHCSFYSRHLGLKMKIFNQEFGHVFPVDTYEVENEEDLQELFDDFVVNNFEGLMVRKIQGKYENKRSFGLLKMKPWHHEYFKIVGWKAGKDKLLGKLGAWICETPEGNKFKVKMACSEIMLEELFMTANQFVNKRELEVKYQELTSKNKVPRFPIGVRFKEVK